MKILVVEDDRTIASGLEYSLHQEGYSTILCGDVASAKKVIEENFEGIGLCLLDLSLPDGSGYDLCENLKNRQEIVWS